MIWLILGIGVAIASFGWHFANEYYRRGNTHGSWE